MCGCVVNGISATAATRVYYHHYYLADIDECAEGEPCDVNADCVDADGSFSCSCEPGFSGDGFNCTRESAIEETVYYPGSLINIKLGVARLIMFIRGGG